MYVLESPQRNRTRDTVPVVCDSPLIEECKRGENCGRLHVCFDYILGRCKGKIRSI